MRPWEVSSDLALWAGEGNSLEVQCRDLSSAPEEIGQEAQGMASICLA